MKKAIKVTIMGLLVASLITGCGCKKKENKPEEKKPEANTNEEVIQDQKLEAFTFTNTSLVYENGTSVLETKVTNTSEEKIYLKEFLIHVYNSKGTEMVTLKGYVGDSIEGKGTKVITTSYGENLTKATKVEYEVIK